MQDVVDPILLLPRYTSFAGTGDFLSAPLNVRAYGHAIVTFYFAAGMDIGGDAVTVSIDQSPDLAIWNDAETVLPLNTPTTVDLRMEWIRLRVVLAEGDPGPAPPALTCWCVGDFVRRHA